MKLKLLERLQTFTGNFLFYYKASVALAKASVKVNHRTGLAWLPFNFVDKLKIVVGLLKELKRVNSGMRWILLVDLKG